MALTLDGHAAASGSVSGTGTIAATLTTSNSDDVIIACIYNEAQGHTAGPHAVSGVSGGGLTWTLRSSQTSTAFNGSALEVWWAHAASPLTSQTITATFSGTSDDASIIVFGISGANVTSPFDTNASVPAKAQATSLSTPAVSGVTTDAAKTFTFGAAGSQTFFSNPGDLTSPLTGQIDNTNTAAGSGESSLIAASDITTVALSSQAFGVNRNCGSWIFIVDSVVEAATDVDLTAAPELGVTQATTLSTEVEFVVSMSLGLADATILGTDVEIAAAALLGVQVAVALEVEKDLVASALLGVNMTATLTTTGHKQPVFFIIT